MATGEGIHAIQDSFSHAGYSFAPFGHLSNMDVDDPTSGEKEVEYIGDMLDATFDPINRLGGGKGILGRGIRDDIRDILNNIGSERARIEKLKDLAASRWGGKDREVMRNLEENMKTEDFAEKKVGVLKEALIPWFDEKFWWNPPWMPDAFQGLKFEG